MALLCIGSLSQAIAQSAAVPAPDAFSHATGDIALGKGYWLSKSRDTPLEMARQQTFKPFHDLLSLSYEKNDLWVRMEIPATRQPVYLHVQPFWLDELEYHDPYTGAPPQLLGDRHLVNGVSSHRQDHAFKVAPAPVARAVYLRVRSSSTYLVYPQVLTEDGLIHAEKTKLLYSSIYVGIFVAILLIILQALIISKDLLIGIFLVKHLCYTLYAIFTLGMFQLIFDFNIENQFLDKAHIFSVFLVVSLTAVYDGYLIGAFKHDRKAWRHYFTASAVFPVALLFLYLFGLESEALYINAIFVLQLCVMLFIGALRTRHHTREQIQVLPAHLITYYFLSVSTVGLSILQMLGMFESGIWKMYVILGQGVFAALMMITILFYRDRNIHLLMQKTRVDLESARKINELEAQRSEEQSHFLNMLMHEIKTPLSTITLALQLHPPSSADNARLALDACREINLVLQRSIDFDKLKDAPQSQRKPVLLSEVIELVISSLQTPSRILLNDAWDGWIETDEHYLRIILSNLMHNALRYSAPDSAIKIQVDAVPMGEEQFVRVCVINRPGTAGWPDPNKLFSKYYRSEGASKQTGTGLGLVVSARLASELGGRIDYCPTTEEVIFALWIPQQAS